MLGFIGKRMREQRQELKMTLTDIAQELGTSKQVIQRYESGVIKNIRLEKVETIARLLNVSPLYLIGVTDEKTPTSNFNSAPAEETPAPAETETIVLDKRFRIQLRIKKEIVSVEVI